MGLGLLVMVSLSVQKHVELIWLLFLFNLEGELALHLKEDLVDVHELWEEVGSRKDEFLRQVLPSAVVHAFAHIALPKAVHLANQVMLKELHRGEDIEESRLLHPIRER